jgi:Kef-type K+ transport system membrane component KefB
MGLALGLTLLAVVGKLIGGGLGMLGHGAHSIAIVGFGMVPRGEVGLIVANLGLSLGAIPGQAFSVVVIMSILTTLVVPPILRALYAGQSEAATCSEDVESQVARLPELDARAQRADGRAASPI